MGTQIHESRQLVGRSLRMRRTCSASSTPFDDHPRLPLDHDRAAFDLVVEGGLDAVPTQLGLGDLGYTDAANEAIATGSEWSSPSLVLIGAL